MALMKGDIGGGGNRRPNTSSTSFIKTLNTRGKDPFLESGLQAGRNAQRQALASYIAKTKQGVDQANMDDMGDMDEEKRRGYRRRYDAGASGSSTAASALPSLEELLGAGMSEDEIRAQASEMFKPQFDYLSGLENAAKGRHKASDSAVAQIYAALQKDYDVQKAPTSAIYNQEEAALKAAYGGGVQAIGKAQDETAARTAAMMKKLGIEQAGAELFKENVADTQAAQQRLLSQQAVDLAGNASTETAALADLGVKRQAAGLEGAEQRSNLQYQLADILAGYGMKRADLSSKQAEAAMDIRSNQSTQQQDAVKMLMQQEQQKFQNELSMGQYDLDRDKFEWDQQQSALKPPAQENLSPYEKFNLTAAQSYENPQSRSNAIGAVEDTFRLFTKAYGRPPANMQEIIQYLEQRNPNAMGPGGDIGTLRNLTSLLYQDRY